MAMCNGYIHTLYTTVMDKTGPKINILITFKPCSYSHGHVDSFNYEKVRKLEILIDMMRRNIEKLSQSLKINEEIMNELELKISRVCHTKGLLIPQPQTPIKKCVKLKCHTNDCANILLRVYVLMSN